MSHLSQSVFCTLLLRTTIAVAAIYATCLVSSNGGVVWAQMHHPMDPDADYFHLPHESVWNFAQNPDHVTVKDGTWFDAATWSNNVVPRQGDVIRINNHVIYDGVSDAAIKAINVNPGGKLEFAVARDTRLKVGTLTVLKGGELTIGTENAPVQDHVTAEIIIADQPLDLINDPMQHGTGILVLNGKLTIFGRKLSETFMRVAEEMVAGDTEIVLQGLVEGWKVDDLILIPDTRGTHQYLESRGGYSHIENIKVAGIRTDSQGDGDPVNDRTILTLNQALQHDHLGARDPDGRLMFLPHVGNLGRNVIVRSENPAGVRGHMLSAGRAEVDLNYFLSYQMGRTRADEHLDNTIYHEGELVHIGTNQIARYSIHTHHLMGPEVGKTPAHGNQFRIRGNAVMHDPKWGITIHGSHYGLIEQNVVYDAVGAGIITEDGSETGNKFYHNFVVGNRGSGEDTYGREIGVDPRPSDGPPWHTIGDFGHEGSGFWFDGAGNRVVGNVSANAFKFGITIWSRFRGNPPVRVPLYQGADTHIEGQYRLEFRDEIDLLEFRDNEAYSSRMTIALEGVAFNNTKPYTVRDTVVWNPGGAGFNIGYSDLVYVDGLTVIGDGGSCTGLNNSFLGHLYARNMSIQNCQTGAEISVSADIENSHFRNKQENIAFTYRLTNKPDSSVVRNVTYQPIAGYELKTVSYRWQVLNAGINFMVPKPVYVINHKGIEGDDFQVYFGEQRADFVPPYSGMGDEALDSVIIEQSLNGLGMRISPVEGWTNAQLWERFGLALGGLVKPDHATQRSGCCWLGYRNSQRIEPHLR